MLHVWIWGIFQQMCAPHGISHVVIKAITSVLSSLPYWTATVLEGLFREYHSSSVAVGQQHPEVTKQPLVHD